jgi:hypothetical protein
MAIGVETPQGAHVEPTKEEARQGQNIKGMMTVLVVSTLLVVAAYGVLLALFGGAETSTDRSPAADITTESTSQPVPALATPETRATPPGQPR